MKIRKIVLISYKELHRRLDKGIPFKEYDVLSATKPNAWFVGYTFRGYHHIYVAFEGTLDKEHVGIPIKEGYIK